MITRVKLMIENVPYEVEQRGDLLMVNGQEFPFKMEGNNVQISGKPHTASIAGRTATVDGICYNFEAIGLDELRPMQKRKAATKDAAVQAGAITAIMPGLIIKVLKKEGDHVEKDDVIMILEAMKMQNEIRSPKSGILHQINVKRGENVEIRQVLAVVE